MNPENRTLVTGATAGIGRAVALKLAENGIEVVAHGRDPERGESLVDEIVRRGGRARFVAADLADPDDVLRLAEEAGEIDILVNNAGVYHFGGTAETGAAGFDKHVAINTRAPFLLVGALVPAMAERGRGVVVNIVSTVGSSPSPTQVAYGASKAAMELLTRTWATEFGPRGVRVNGVSPGAVRTPGTAPLLEAFPDAERTMNARGRIGEPEEIAEVVAFLAGEQSSYVNGTVIPVHGGELSTVPA
jgi:NAD(P)-dependent dehydrogenase (short-subunit alcohol dehydrogenase family)